MYRLDDAYTTRLHMKMLLTHWKCTMVKTCRKVYRAHWRWGKLVVCNISTVTNDRAYWCIKREREATENCHEDCGHYTNLYWEAACNKLQPEIQCQTTLLLCCPFLSFHQGWKRFDKDDIGITAENKKKHISFNVKITVKLARWPKRMVMKYLKTFSCSSQTER